MPGHQVQECTLPVLLSPRTFAGVRDHWVVAVSLRTRVASAHAVNLGHAAPASRFSLTQPSPASGHDLRSSALIGAVICVHMTIDPPPSLSERTRR
jgi:hypothetical protein